MPITIDGNGTITGAATLATTVANPTFTTPNINSAQFATVSGTAPIYPCRAWVNFNGTGTVAIRASGNVTSITDNGTGDYRINFTTAMPDVNYAIGANAGYGPGGSGRYLSAPTSNGFATDFLTTSVRLNTVYTYNSPQDCEVVTVAVFR